MRRLLFVFFFLIVATFSYAKVMQRGRVIIYESQGMKLPASNFSFHFLGYESVISDEDGYFEYEFRERKKGDLLPDVVLENKGYVLVNREQTLHWKLSNKEDLVLVLCEEKTYHIIHGRNMTPVKKLYQKAFVENDSLDKNFELSFDNLDSYVYEYTNLQMLNDDELILKGYRAIKDGKIPEAVEMFEKENLLEAYKSSDKKSSDSIEVLLRAQIALMSMSADGKKYEEALELCKQVYLAKKRNRIGLRYADFLLEANKYQESFAIYNELSNAKHSRTAALARSSLALNYLRQDDYVKALNIAEQGLNDLNNLNRKNKTPEQFLRERSLLHFMIMFSTYSIGDYKTALENMDKAVEYGRQFCDIAPMLFARRYAQSLISICGVCVNLAPMSDFKVAEEKGRQYAKENVEICENLCSHSKDRDIDLLAGAYLMVANTLDPKESFDECEKYFVKAERMYEECFLHNQSSHYFDLAVCYQNHAMLYIEDLKNYRDKANKTLNKAMKVLEDAYRQTPEMIANALLITYHSAVMANAEYDFDTAWEYSSKILDIADKIYEKSPDNGKLLMAMAYHAIGVCLKSNTQYEAALEYFNKALSFDPYDSDIVKGIKETEEAMAKHSENKP